MEAELLVALAIVFVTGLVWFGLFFFFIPNYITPPNDEVERKEEQ